MENFHLYVGMDALLVDAALNSDACKEGNLRRKGRCHKLKVCATELPLKGIQLEVLLFFVNMK